MSELNETQLKAIVAELAAHHFPYTIANSKDPETYIVCGLVRGEHACGKKFNCVRDWCEHIRALAATSGTPAPTGPAPEYPKPCGLCPGQIESVEDLDWHGLGNCVPICETCDGSGIMPDAGSAKESYDHNAVAMIKNLSMLVRRLAHKHHNSKLVTQSLNYLRGEGLQGSVLREPMPPAPPPADETLPVGEKAPGEDAWLDELEEATATGAWTPPSRAAARTILRAYRANLLAQPIGAQGEGVLTEFEHSEIIRLASYPNNGVTIAEYVETLLAAAREPAAPTWKGPQGHKAICAWVRNIGRCDCGWTAYCDRRASQPAPQPEGDKPRE
jgi:hypothetical protein